MSNHRNSVKSQEPFQQLDLSNRRSSNDELSNERDHSPLRHSMIDMRNNNGLENVEEDDYLLEEEGLDYPRI